MANIKGITIEIEGKTSGLTKSLNDVNKTLRQTQDSLKVVNKALKLDPKNIDTIKQKQGLLTKAIDETRQKLEMEKKVALDAGKALEEGTISKEQYDALQAEVAKTTAELKNLEDEAKNTKATLDGIGSGGLSNLSSTIQAAGQQLEAFGNKLKSIGDGMQQLGGNLTKSITAPIVGFGKASLDSFNEVDGAMDTVIKKTGATGAEAEALNDIMKELATSSDVAGTSFEEASVAVGEINTRFGVTGDQLTDLSKQFIKFAKINDSDLNSSIDSVQKALASFGMETKDASALMDVLTRTSQKTGVSVDTLASGLVSNSAAFQEMGLSAYQASEFMGQLEVSGADMTTVMSGMQKALKNATADGMTMDEALSALQNTILNGKDGMDGLTASYDLFGKSGANVYEAVKNGTIDFQNMNSSVGILNESLGVVSGTFTETQDGIDQMTVAQNSMKDAMSEVGATIGETLAPMLSDLAEAVRGVAEWWRSLNPETQQFIIKAAMLAAVLGPVLIIIGSLISAIGTIITTIGGAVTAIGALTAAEGTAAAVTTGVVVPSLAALSATLLPIIGVIAAVAAVVGVVIAVVKNWGAITEWVGEKWSAFKDFIGDLWGGIKMMASDAWNGIKDGIQNAVQGAKDWLNGAWEGIKTTASNAWNNMKTTASNVWNGLKTGVTTIVDGLKSSVSEKWSAIKERASSAWGSIKDSISSKAGSIKEAAVSAFNGMRDGIKGVLDGAQSWGADMMSNISSGISGAIGKVRSAASNVAGVIRSILHFSEPDIGPLSDFHTYMPDMIDMMTSGIMKGIPKVEASAARLGSAIDQGVRADYSGQLGQINSSIQGINLAGATNVYVQISDGQLERALAKITRGQALRSGGR